MESSTAVSYRQVELERLKFVAQQYVSKELIEDFAIGPRIDLMEQHVFDALVYQLRQEVFAEHLDRTEVRYPATWREACKAALYAWLQSGHWPWGGDYAARRWPVRYREIKIDVKALYPKIAMPDRNPFVTVLRREWERDAH